MGLGGAKLIYSEIKAIFSQSSIINYQCLPDCLPSEIIPAPFLCLVLKLQICVCLNICKLQGFGE